jgi:hypothetical protein
LAVTAGVEVGAVVILGRFEHSGAEEKIGISEGGTDTYGVLNPYTFAFAVSAPLIPMSDRYRST